MKKLLKLLGIGFRDVPYTSVEVPTPGQAVYQSPSGARIPFDFEDVTSSFDMKAAVFETASGNGSYVQPNGHTSGRLPMACIFHGPEFAKKAEAFLSAILETGVGELTHPQYQRPISVVPVGSVDIFDGFVSGTNQTILTVTFFETTGLLVDENEFEFEQSYDDLTNANSVDFSNSINVDDTVDRENFYNTVVKTVQTVKSVLKKGCRGLAAATDGIEDVGDSIIRGIDVLIGAPLTMAYQTQVLIGTPARQFDLAIDKLSAYKNLAQMIFGMGLANANLYSKNSLNTYHLNLMIASSTIGSAAKLAVGGSDQFQTRDEYIRQAEFLLGLQHDYQEWADNNYANIAGDIDTAIVDSGTGMSHLLNMIGGAVSTLITKSFGAKMKMSIELPNDRTPIDLCFELYGTVRFETLDFFYSSNDLGGDEYFLIPKGRKIAWYV